MREAFTVGIVLAAKDMYSGVMAKAQRNLGILRKTSKDTADAFEKSIKRYQTIAAAGAAISMVSGQLSGKIQEMTTDAVDFSDAMGKIGTVVDVAGTKFKSNQEAMEAWRTKGLEVSTRSLYTATELINDVAYNLMSAGLKADTAMDLAESVAGTAMATIGDLNTSSKLFGSIMNTFGKTWDMSALEKGNRIMGTLSGAVKRFQWTGDILAESLSWATAAAKGANVEFEETIAALGMLNTRGWEASKAGMAIQTFIREISKGSKKLGITVTDASGQMLPLADILEKLHKKFGDLNLAKQDKLVAAFGARGARLVQILWGEHEALRQNTKALKDSGVAADMVKARMETLDAELKLVEHRWQNMRIELGDRAVPVMTAMKKGVIDLVDVLGEIPGAEAFAGTTLGIIGLVAEVGKTIGPALTMVGVLGMWKTQAALAATAQAALNKQMGISAATSGTQAMKMGMLGSKGGALVGVLGRVAAVGAAAFIGWEIGTLLRQIPGLDEAVQKLFATLTGAKIGDEVDKEITKVSEILTKLKKDIATEEEKKFFIKIGWEIARRGGRSYEEFIAQMGRFGISKEEITHTGAKSTYPITAAANLLGFRTGTARVPRTGMAFVHEGEEITPKSMAGGGDVTTVVHMGGVTINLKSTGSAQMDAHQIKRELDRLYKMEARRLP